MAEIIIILPGAGIYSRSLLNAVGSESTAHISKRITPSAGAVDSHVIAEDTTYTRRSPNAENFTGQGHFQVRKFSKHGICFPASFLEH